MELNYGGHVQRHAACERGGGGVIGTDFQGRINHGLFRAGSTGDMGGGDSQQGELMEGIGPVLIGQCLPLVLFHDLLGQPVGFGEAVHDVDGHAGQIIFHDGEGGTLAVEHVQGAVLGAVGDNGLDNPVFLDGGPRFFIELSCVTDASSAGPRVTWSACGISIVVPAVVAR